MTRYHRDYYGREQERWGEGGAGMGGLRSDGWGSHWREFPGEEGWYGGRPEWQGTAYDRGYGRGRGGEAEPRGYGEEFRGRSAHRGWETGYGGREGGYAEGWRGGPGGNWGEERSWRPSGGQRGRDRIRAADIMTEDPQTVTPDASLQDAARKMRDLDVGIIPVVESAKGKRLKGVITDRDIAVRAIGEGKDGSTKVSEIMTTDVDTVNKNDSVHDVMLIMRREQVRRVPVTDREGRLVGIIAQADLAVDYMGEVNGETEVSETIERISEPARPRIAAKGRGRELTE